MVRSHGAARSGGPLDPLVGSSERCSAETNSASDRTAVIVTEDMANLLPLARNVATFLILRGRYDTSTYTAAGPVADRTMEVPAEEMRCD